MGSAISCVWGKFFSKKSARILMLGLDSAGKSSILYKLKLGEVISSAPTIGFNVERVDFQNISFTVWDVGGQDKIRSFWRYYYEDVQALIFVVDSTDRARIREAKDELHKVVNDELLKNIKVIVFANKQDLSDHMTVAEVCDRLLLHRIIYKNWMIVGTSAISGDGLNDGLKWLADNIE